MRVRSRKKDVRKEVTYKGLDCSKRSASKPVQNSREINGTIVAEEVWVASRRVASRRVASRRVASRGQRRSLRDPN